MEIDLILRARDACDLTTTVSATIQIGADDRPDAVVETIVHYARAAAEQLREESACALTGAGTRDFIPWATYLATVDPRRDR